LPISLEFWLHNQTDKFSRHNSQPKSDEYAWQCYLGKIQVGLVCALPPKEINALAKAPQRDFVTSDKLSSE